MKTATPPSAFPVWRVVVIEDSQEDRDEIRRLLLRGSDRQYRCVEAETGAAGLRAVFDAPLNSHGGPPDCVVLDYVLPDMDALEVLASMAGADGLTVCPVVVLTGSVGSRRGPVVLRAGAQDFIGKSWMTAESLTRAVENATERWAMTREIQARRAALQLSEAQLQLAVEVAGLGVNRIDYVTNTVILDTIAASLFGLPAEVPLPRSAIHATFHPDDKAEIVRLMDQSLDPTGDGTFSMEHRVVRRDGSTRWLNVKKQVVFGDVGGVRRPVTGVLAAVDITDRKRAEEALRQADQRKDEFLATLAHELRNPLAPIRNGLFILRMARLPDQAEKVVGMMDRQLGHMVNLVDDLLDVSRVRTGKITLRAELVTVREAVDAAVEACRPTIDEKSHTLEVNLPTESLPVAGDKTRLVQVVANLLTNAAKYSERGGRIRVTVAREGGEAVIRVSDNGMGIAPELIPTLWDMFTQVRDTLDKAQGGLGIGLSLVKKIVEMHGGMVAAESVGVGHGSTFTVRLPLAAADVQREPATASAKQTPAPRPASRRVLVLDDNVDGAESLAMMIEHFGHACRVAHDGPAGLSVAREFQPEVVFLDIGLPVMNGYEVAKRFRADPAIAGAVLVALTGWGSEDDKQKSREAGFDFHLTKPIQVQAVQDLLARFSPTTTV